MYDKCVKSIILVFPVARGELLNEPGLTQKFSIINKLQLKAANLFIILLSQFGKELIIFLLILFVD